MPAPDLLAGPDERRPLRAPPAPVAVAAVVVVTLVAGLLTAVRLSQVDVVVVEGVGGAERSAQRQVRGEVRLLVRNGGRLPVRLVAAELVVTGVDATTTASRASARPGADAAVDVRFAIDDCGTAAASGALRLRLRPEHGPARDVDVPVSVDGRDGSARIATLLGFCAPPFSR